MTIHEYLIKTNQNDYKDRFIYGAFADILYKYYFKKLPDKKTVISNKGFTNTINDYPESFLNQTLPEITNLLQKIGDIK